MQGKNNHPTRFDCVASPPPPHWRRPYSQAIISLILFATRMKIRRSLRKRIAALPNFNCQSVMRERHALDLLLTL